jgi:hypothetical protein
MKVKKEIKNGFLIFISIGAFFLLMEFLGLSNIFYLRLLNVFFVFYAVNDTLRSRISEGKTKFVSNVVASLVTCTVGVFLSIVGLLIYSYMRGGDAYIHSLSESFLFGGYPSINMYCFSLFFEGMASAVIVTLLLILYHNDKFVTD